MNSAIVPGSIGAMAQRNGCSLAESFLSADYIAIVDVSGSMDSHDACGGQTRYTVACDELRKLQAQHPGKIAVVEFSDHPAFVPGGVPSFQGGGTDLTNALQFVEAADGCATFIIISDGEPDDEKSALDVAKRFTSKIDTVYVGPDTNRSGAEVLRRLAASSGGQSVVAEKAEDLAGQVNTLMLNGR